MAEPIKIDAHVQRTPAQDSKEVREICEHALMQKHRILGIVPNLDRVRTPENHYAPAYGYNMTDQPAYWVFIDLLPPRGEKE